MDDGLIQQSCRIALAAYLRDLGKFAERADALERDPRLDAHLTLHCPFHRAGESRWFTRRYVAYTVLALDLIEKLDVVAGRVEDAGTQRVVEP